MTISKEKQAQQEKDTGLAAVLIFLIITLTTGKNIYTISAIALLVATMTVPAVFRPLSYIWFGFSKLLGEIVSRILLTLVFVFMAIPVGGIRKVFGADSMKLKQWKHSQESMFVDRNHTYGPADLEKPY